MIEALQTGTPVIAFERGGAPEIVIDGQDGFLVSDVAGMWRRSTASTRSTPLIAVVEWSGFDVATVCGAYEGVYADAISRTTSATSLAAR